MTAIDLDKRLEQLFDDFADECINAESGQMASPGYTKRHSPETLVEAKRLISDVLRQVKPDRAGHGDLSYKDMDYGHDEALDQMEARVKALGL